MKHALVEKSGRVAQVVDTASQKFEVHPDLQWVEAPDSVEQDDRFVDGVHMPKNPMLVAQTNVKKFPVSE